MRISDWSSDVCSSDLCITLRTISRSASGSCASNSLTADTAGLISVLVMAGLLGDVEHHQPAMTASLLKRFCRTSRTLPLAPAYPPCVRALGSQRKARIRISIIPIGICPASSQERAVQSVETLEQDGRKIHASPQSRQKSRCCRGYTDPFPRWHNLAIGYS